MKSDRQGSNGNLEFCGKPVNPIPRTVAENLGPNRSWKPCMIQAMSLRYYEPSGGCADSALMMLRRSILPSRMRRICTSSALIR